MIAFFIILAVLMVLVVAAGRWSAESRGRGRRVIYDRDVVVDRGPDIIEEEVFDDVDRRPVARSRRVVRRRRSY